MHILVDLSGKYHYKKYSRLKSKYFYPEYPDIIDFTQRYSDVMMGIFLSENEADFNNIVQHQKQHEKGGSWSRRKVLIMWGMDDISDNDVDVDSFTAKNFSAVHYGSLALDKPDNLYNYEVTRIYVKKSSNPIHNYICKLSGLDWACAIPNNAGCVIDKQPFENWIVDKIDFLDPYDRQLGVTKYSSVWNTGLPLIIHMGHGQIWGPSAPNLYHDIFSNGKINSKCSPFFITMSCSTGFCLKSARTYSFAYQSQINPVGTCATYAPTINVYTPDIECLLLGIYYAMFPEDGRKPLRNIGEIIKSAEMATPSRARDYFHLFGDPMTNLNLFTPQYYNKRINDIKMYAFTNHNEMNMEKSGVSVSSI